MSGLLLLLTLLFSVASPFAPGMIAYTDFSSLQSKRVEAETISETSSLLPLRPKVASFEYNPKKIPVKTELYTTLNVLYKAHGDPLMQYISAYDIRDKTLLWRKTLQGARIDGIELLANGTLLICGTELESAAVFCISLHDEGLYDFEDVIIVPDVAILIDKQKIRNKQDEKQKQTVAAEHYKREMQQELEASLMYKLQQDETHKASTTTLQTIIDTRRTRTVVLQEAIAKKEQDESVVVCKEGAQLCIPNLESEVLITAKPIPIQVISSETFEYSEPAVDPLRDTVATSTLEKQVIKVGPIEGDDGIFDYNDVVDYRTCFHMCYYVENSSWKKCTKRCDERF